MGKKSGKTALCAPVLPWEGEFHLPVFLKTVQYILVMVGNVLSMSQHCAWRATIKT